jgi:predicted lipoprotein with Yx(FWY)xxD motif
MLTNIPSTLPTNWSVTTRTDGTKQYTYKGMPLYFYSKDTKPEDVTGDGVGGVWHLVKP